MINYAIILGVDEYQNAQSLPACKCDAELMETFLKATGKYTILKIPSNASKHQIQEYISSFLPTDSSEVGEVLFYFSGHGKQDENGLHYALFDTDVSRINSTSFNNNELDDAVRKCSPRLYVKIIDACQSGLSYIKGFEDIVDESGNNTPKGFNNCIFLCSSLKTQLSYTDKPYSKFTKAVIDAVKNVSTSSVKYIDVQNYLSDVFNTTGVQTPYFSTQCDGTEVFCEKTPTVLDFLEKMNFSTVQGDANSQPQIEAVRSYLKKCRSENEVKKLIENAQEMLQEWKPDQGLLKEFYECKFEAGFPYEYHKFFEESSIVKMLYTRVAKESLFVKVKCESVEKTNPLRGSVFSRYVEEPVSYRSLAKQLPSVFSLHFSAYDEDLPDYVAPFIFVYSPTFVYVFTCTKQYVRKGWDEYEVGQCTKYTYTRIEYHKFTESVWRDYQTKCLEKSAAFIEKTLLEYVQE